MEIKNQKNLCHKLDNSWFILLLNTKSYLKYVEIKILPNKLEKKNIKKIIFGKILKNHCKRFVSFCIDYKLSDCDLKEVNKISK